MGIFDWLFSPDPEPEKDPGVSRRAFFAKMAGAGAQPGRAPEARPSRPDAVCSFFVDRFPYHDGPILVPLLKPGLEFQLFPDRDHPTDPQAVRIQWKRDVLGYVPAAYSADIRERLGRGERLRCRSATVNPGGDLKTLLYVEILAPDVEEEPQRESEADPADDTREASPEA